MDFPPLAKKMSKGKQAGLHKAASLAPPMGTTFKFGKKSPRKEEGVENEKSRKSSENDSEAEMFEKD